MKLSILASLFLAGSAIAAGAGGSGGSGGSKTVRPLLSLLLGTNTANT